MYHDDGNSFWQDGDPTFVVRGDLSPAEWARIPIELKKRLLSFCRQVGMSHLEGLGSVLQQIRVPRCAYCGEPILPGEMRAPVIGPPMHHECGFRMVGGSVGHQQGRCECIGEIDMSELGISRREAARRALDYFKRYN